MTTITVTILLLLLIIASVSAIRITRLRLSWKSKAFFLSLRCTLIALIAISFIEPVMVFEQLPAQRGTVPVLIDASKSMRLFIRDSTILRTLAQLEAWNAANSDKKKNFVFYSFGDSLVRLKENTHTIKWSDKRSFLPETIKDPVVRRSNSMLLISDGNWSNASLPAAAYSDKNVFYLPLRGEGTGPYLQIAIPGFPEVSSIDSQLVVNAVVEGVTKRQDGALSITLMEKDRRIERKTIPVPMGVFRKEVKFSLEKAAPGRHLYRFDAHSVYDSVNSICYALHSKLPGKFYYSIYDKRPTLDRRFIQLALKSQRDFVESTVAGKRHDPDLLILFDWDRNARQLMDALKPSGAALFIGTLPCSTVTVRSAAGLQLIRSGKSVQGGPLEGLDAGKLPPPTGIAYCKSLRIPPQNVFLTATIPAPGRTDTFNLLFTGRTGNRDYIACAATDIWRWDFLPLAIEQDEGRSSAFSQRLISFSKETLVNALSEELYLYPPAALSESDSLAFRVVFPVGIPVSADIKLSCKFTSAQRGPFDTVFMITSTGAQKQTIRFKPLPCGAWLLEASAVSNNRRYRFADSVFIPEDRSEYMVNGQNTALLQEIAQPVSDFSAATLNSLFFAGASEINHPVKRTFHLNRSWPLLLLIFLLFSVEWIARRMLKLD